MLILADDLTGAADAGAAFAVHGHQTRVLLARDAAPAVGPAVDPALDSEVDPEVDTAVISVDVNGRAMPVHAAIAATTAAMQRYAGSLASGRRADGRLDADRPQAVRPVFIKIDSTVRGHVRATVEAVLAALPRPPSRVVVCPALPSLGRTVIDGSVHVDGEPLPAGNLGDLFSGFPAGSGLFISAAQTDEDLAALVRSIDDDVLWVGSAGLARHVAERIAVVPHEPLAREASGKVVVIVGSRHRATIDQLARLDKNVSVLRIDPRDRSFLAGARPTIAAADGLVLTGGYTARAVLDLFGVSRFDVGGEVEVGVPWGRAEIGGRPIGLVTKAGGFGDDDSLQRAVDFLAGP